MNAYDEAIKFLEPLGKDDPTVAEGMTPMIKLLQLAKEKDLKTWEPGDREILICQDAAVILELQETGQLKFDVIVGLNDRNFYPDVVLNW